MYNLNRYEIEQMSMRGVGVEEVGEGYSRARALGCHWLYLWDEDTSITPHIKAGGFWEAWVTSWFTKWVRPGMTVIDIGAHCGYFTMLSEKLVGPYGRVVAYEPNPIYVKALEMTKNANNANFELYPYAVGDRIKKVGLHVPRHLTGSASTVADLSAYDEQIIDVHQTTLNSEYLARHDIIKIDAEGAEQLIWNGGSTVWQHGHTTLVMEWTPGAYDDRFFDELSAWGEVTGIGFEGEEFPMTKTYLEGLQDWVMVVVRRR